MRTDGRKRGGRQDGVCRTRLRANNRNERDRKNTSSWKKECEYVVHLCQLCIDISWSLTWIDGEIHPISNWANICILRDWIKEQSCSSAFLREVNRVHAKVWKESAEQLNRTQRERQKDCHCFLWELLLYRRLKLLPWFSARKKKTRKLPFFFPFSSDDLSLSFVKMLSEWLSD